MITISQAFPNLTDVDNKKTSDATPLYNCIAWAFGDNTRHWWPNTSRSFWPMATQGLSAMDAFSAWFVTDGWTPTTDESYSAEIIKVALYAKNGEPTHASRLIDDGLWTSKLGSNIDLSHGFLDLDGPEYGRVHKIFMKPYSTI
jgi:hypothetical protein